MVEAGNFGAWSADEKSAYWCYVVKSDSLPQTMQYETIVAGKMILYSEIVVK